MACEQENFEEQEELGTPENNPVKNSEKNSEKDYEKELAELNDKYRRSLAEFDNFRKRTIKEKAALYDMGIAEAVDKILPVVDNFERAALTFANKEDDGIYKGFEMILKQLRDILFSLGVEDIECIGQPFDPKLHHAVATVQTDDAESGVIVEQIQKGYSFKDKILRPSMVCVAK
jgi:molecular chaperone GrpE